MCKKQSVSNFTADFETTTAAYSEEKTKVWLWGIVNVKDWANDSKVSIGTNLMDFEGWISRNIKDGDVIWFHNAKFDGSFLLNYYFNEGYELVNSIKKTYCTCAIETLISEQNTWYQIGVKCGPKRYWIKNSLCLLNSSVANIGDSFQTRKRKLELDYDNAKLDPKDITDDDREYIRCDVQIMAEVMNTLLNTFGLDRLTAGANAMSDYIERIGGQENFKSLFPEIGEEVDEYLRPGYKGGWCYVKPNRKERRLLAKGCTFDVNSLYPSMMHSMSGNAYPYGKPLKYKGKYKQDDKYPLWMGKCIIMCHIKPNKMPCIQVKKSNRFNEHAWLDLIDEPTELVITSVDWELIQECYEIDAIKWIDGYKFQAAIGLFDVFIDHWYAIKRGSKGAKKQLAKLMLNSFYGKFATRLWGCNKIPYLDKNDVLRFKYSDPEEHKAYYLPVGAFTTAYARRFTITAANLNYERFCYADTDSLHLLGRTEPKGITIDSNELCCWKDELYWDDAIFLRQKTYMEHAEGTDRNGWEVKCAGMPERIKSGVMRDEAGNPVFDKKGRLVKEIKISPEAFFIGAEFPSGKLRPKQVKGGIILVDGPFKIRPVT